MNQKYPMGCPKVDSGPVGRQPWFDPTHLGGQAGLGGRRVAPTQLTKGAAGGLRETLD